MKKIAILLYVATSSFAHANSDITKDPEYIKTNILVKKYGKEGFVQQIVKLQNDMMAKSGGTLAINPYSSVIQLVGMPNGLVIQIVEIDVNKLNNDSSKTQESQFKYENAVTKLKKALSAGGKLYEAQINSICTTPNFMAQLDNEIVYIFKYYDKKARYISSIEMDKKLCRR